MGGGIARWMGELAKRFPPGSLVVSTAQHPPASGSNPVLPTLIDRLPIESQRLRTIQGNWHWSRRAAQLVRSHGVAFVWCGNIKPAAYPARWVKLRLGVRYGILLHGGDLLILRHQARSSRLKRYTARALLGGASVLVGNSRWTADLCRQVMADLGVDLQRVAVEVVPLGTDPAVFRPGLDTGPVRQRYRLDQRRWLLSVARLTRHKGIDVAIRVVADLASEFPDLGYIVVGTGEELPALQSLASSFGVADRVRFLTDVPDSDLPGLYNCAEVYLGLSRLMEQRVEGFGISLVEASACGLPVLAGRSGGIPDAVREGETGLLVDAEQAGLVSHLLRRLLQDRKLAARLGAGGREAAESYFNWDRVIAEVMRIGETYAEVGRLKPPSPRVAR
jgi:phosphatidyl-myo-inositol dimannoside synthase